MFSTFFSKTRPVHLLTLALHVTTFGLAATEVAWAAPFVELCTENHVKGCDNFFTAPWITALIATIFSCAFTVAYAVVYYNSLTPARDGDDGFVASPAAQGRWDPVSKKAAAICNTVALLVWLAPVVIGWLPITSGRKWIGPTGNFLYTFTLAKAADAAGADADTRHYVYTGCVAVVFVQFSFAVACLTWLSSLASAFSKDEGKKVADVETAKTESDSATKRDSMEESAPAADAPKKKETSEMLIHPNFDIIG